jgi:arsenate reductase (glutaredoxin)
MKYYHNPRCSKSRQGLALLNSKKINYDVIEYLKTPLNKSELIDILDLLDINPMDLIRKGEAVFKEQIKGKNLNDEQIIELMIKEPKLIERPILVNDGKAVIGRPAENLLSIVD